MLMTDIHTFKKEKLDKVSCSFCIAKWKQVTIHLHNGHTHSCHHPAPHKIPIEELKDNPSALHNTNFKKQQRKKMLEGDRPNECDYCWRVEDSGSDSLSDRTYKSAEPWSQSYLEDIVSKPWDDNVNPSYLEVSFSSVCNFKCSYCSPQVSSKWMEEIQQHGPYPTSTKFNNLDYLRETNSMPIPNREHNPYVEAFWKWWPDVSKDLHHFRITGGEPLLAKDTFKVLDDLIANPKPNLEVSINSNMCIPDAVFNNFIEKIKIICNEGKVKKFKIFTSAEAHGAQAEYIRHGLNYNQWLDNIHRVLREVPNCSFTCMSTYNFLSLFSFKEFSKDILDIKQEYGGHDVRLHPMILDVPFLRHPPHQAIFIMPEKFKKYVYDQVTYVHENVENPTWYGTANNRFYQWEADKFKRLYEIITYIDETHETKPHVIENRLNFIKFVNEHDRRRGTNFLKTFPEMEEEYYKWSKL
jgi:organic radical activating enzyme